MRNEDWEYISDRNGYSIYRRIVDGKGKWKAERDGEEFAITYEQARGYEPLDDEEALRMELGRILLPT